MITVIRRYFKDGSHIVLWVIIAAFIIGFVPIAFRQATKSIWAIRVNGQEIGYQEFTLERERQRERIMMFRSQYGEYADFLLSLMGGADPQFFAIRSLVKQELMNQYADALGIHIGDDFVIKKMNDRAFVKEELGDFIPPQMIDPVTGFDQNMLGRYLKRMGLSIDLFERQIERLLVDKLVADIVTSTLYVPLFDIRLKLLADHAKKSFSLLSFSVAPFIEQEKKQEVPLEKLNTFYEAQNKRNNRYLIPEKRAGLMWTFSPESYRVTVTDAQLEDYYENNKVKKYIESPAKVTVRTILFAISDATQPASVQQKAAQIKQQLQKDSSQFATLAERFSDDKVSASKGGLLDPFVRGSHEPSFDRAAFILQKDGDISDVIETSRGFEIVQRVSKIPQKFKPLSSVKKEIHALLEKQLFQKQFIADIRKVIDHEEALATFIKQKGGMPKEISQIALDDSPLAQHLFKLQIGQRAFFVDESQGVAVRLDAIKEKYTPSLDTIKTTVLDDYYEEQAHHKMQTAVAEAKKAATHQSVKELQKTITADFIQTGWIVPDEQSQIESFKKKGFPVEKMLQMEKSGSFLTHIDDQRGFLIRLDEIEPLEPLKDERGQALLAPKLEQERLQQYMEGFVASLYRNATIETNESVITLQA